jgi:hypothetical protein
MKVAEHPFRFVTASYLTRIGNHTRKGKAPTGIGA